MLDIASEYWELSERESRNLLQILLPDSLVRDNPKSFESRLALGATGKR